jgi:hypothetical protein
MAFKTYQCEQYKKYLVEHNDKINEIYKIMDECPYTYTQLGKLFGMDYFAFARRYKLRILTVDQIITLLDYIK